MAKVPVPQENLVRQWLALPGREILAQLLEQKAPAQIVQNLPFEDFFWLVKSIGDDDCLPVLELASEEQWEYLLDLELWEKDRLNPKRALSWLKKLCQADGERLAKWLLEDGRSFFSFCLHQSTEIIMREEESNLEPPPGFNSIDGIFFFKAHSADDQDTIELLLKLMAAQDFEAYQEFMHELTIIIPAEAEEELYRLRNVRIREHGFAPYEEALAIYSPLTPEVLSKKEHLLPPGAVVGEGETLPVPATPLMLLDGNNLLLQVLSQTEDPTFRDRLRLEYAGLSNKVIAAGAFEEIADREVLASAWIRAGNYLHLALTYLHGRDLKAAEKTLRDHQLETLFRVGWGFAVRLRDMARKWVEMSWFHACGRKSDFWGSPWGEILDGLMASRPVYFDGRSYRDFSTLEDIKRAEEFIEQMRLLDLLLRRMHVPHLGEGPLPSQIETFHPLLFNPWAYRLLKEEPSVKPLSRPQAIRFFRLVREGESTPPYKMEKFRSIFMADFMAGAKDLTDSEQDTLKKTLSSIWDEFVQVYENVKVEDLDGRFSPYLLISRN